MVKLFKKMMVFFVLFQVRLGKEIFGRNIFMGSDDSKKTNLYNSHKNNVKTEK